MAYTGGVEIPQIYCSGDIDKACHLIDTQYDRPVEQVGRWAMRYVLERLDRGRKDFVEQLVTCLGEAVLVDMFRWLRYDCGWDNVRFVPKNKHEKGGQRGSLSYLDLGRRVRVRSQLGEAELDCLIRIGDDLLIGEAKSGTNSFRLEDVTKKVDRLHSVSMKPAGFVLAVPSDHCVFNDSPGTGEYLVDRGGRILTFDADAKRIKKVANDLYNGDL